MSSTQDTTPAIPKYLSRLLVLINVFSSTRDGFGPLAATYLLVEAGWTEASIGIAMFANSVASMLFQTFAGDIVDKTPHKRTMLSVSIVGVGLMCLLMVMFPSMAVVVITRIIQVRPPHLPPRYQPFDRVNNR